jgi:hypothetical protein
MAQVAAKLRKHIFRKSLTKAIPFFIHGIDICFEMLAGQVDGSPGLPDSGSTSPWSGMNPAPH